MEKTELDTLLKSKTEQHQMLIAQHRVLEEKKQALIQEILRLEGEIRLLQQLDGQRETRTGT